MTGREHQAQEVVADVIVQCGIEIRRHLPIDLPAQLLVLPLEPLSSPQQIDCAVLGRGHQPGARIVRDARLRPPLQRRDQRILCQLLGEPHVADHPRETRDQSRRLDPVDRVDCAMRVGRRHGD